MSIGISGTDLYGDMTLQYESGNYYLDFRAAEAGRKTQSYELSGGKWGSFKYFFSYDQLPHNFTYDAKSFYQGVGGANSELSDPASQHKRLQLEYV